MPLNIDFQQILLHLFNFILLGGGLYLLLYKPVKKFMDNRKAQYEDMEAKTKTALEEAYALKAEYEDNLAGVDALISEDRAKANSDIRKKCDEELAEARNHAAEIVDKARKEAENERARILANAQKDIAVMAEEAAQKVLMNSVSDAYDQFLDGAEGSVNDEQC